MLLRLHLSTLAVDLEFHDADTVAATLRAVFRGALRPIVPSTAERRYRVEATDLGMRILHPGGRSVELDCVLDVAPVLERALYADLLRSQQEQGIAMLHAACFHDGSRAYLVMGDSGAGKSALARAAVARGLRYLGDEHAFTDGRELWGLPRAIHLDPHPETAPALPWHAGADLGTYLFRDSADRSIRLPLVHVPEERVAVRPVALDSAIVIEAQRGPSDAVARLDRTAQLALLDRCILVASPTSAMALAAHATGRRLTWSDPDRALELLLDELDRARTDQRSI